jgi:hypothetical protein
MAEGQRYRGTARGGDSSQSTWLPSVPTLAHIRPAGWQRALRVVVSLLRLGSHPRPTVTHPSLETTIDHICPFCSCEMTCWAERRYALQLRFGAGRAR